MGNKPVAREPRTRASRAAADSRARQRPIVSTTRVHRSRWRRRQGSGRRGSVLGSWFLVPNGRGPVARETEQESLKPPNWTIAFTYAGLRSPTQRPPHYSSVCNHNKTDFEFEPPSMAGDRSVDRAEVCGCRRAVPAHVLRRSLRRRRVLGGFWALNSGASVGTSRSASRPRLSCSQSARLHSARPAQHQSAWPFSWSSSCRRLHLPEPGIRSLVWRHIFAVIGSVAVGCAGVRRLAAPAQAQCSPESSIAVTSDCRQPSGLQKMISARNGVVKSAIGPTIALRIRAD